MTPTGLIIAGLDPSGGAGLIRDTIVFSQFGVHPLGVITANTSQNSCGAYRQQPIGVEFFKHQLEVLKEDFSPSAAKVGMLSRSVFLKIALETFKGIPFVVDPVMFSKNGKPLVDNPEVYKELAEEIFLITPNLNEAKYLTNLQTEEPLKLLETLKGLGFKNVLLKGGHSKNPLKVIDYLLTEEGKLYTFTKKRINKHPRGTGCALSSAITALLVKGYSLPEAVKEAENYLERLIKKARKLGRCYEIFIP
jgi:hydroxymethylpyrimidine/phosphomethylpyrimidine kinase